MKILPSKATLSTKYFTLQFASIAVALILNACGGNGDRMTSTPAATPPIVQICANGATDYPTCSPAVSPANLQLTVPAPPYAAGSEDLKAFNYLNDLRQKMGLGLLAYSAELDKASANHANYLVINKVYQHDEDPLKSGFTGVNATAQARFAGYSTNYWIGGGLAMSNSKTGTIAILVNTVYHRSQLFGQNWRDTGSATFCYPPNCLSTDGVVNNIFLGQNDPQGQTNASDFVTVYPIDHQVDVPLSMGNEHPTPFPVEYPDELTYKKVGSPVSFYVESKQILILKTFTMTQADQMTPVDAFVRTKANDPNALFIGNNEAYLVAKAPLKPLTTYNMKVTASVNGKDIEKAWSFTTAEKYMPSF